MTVLVVLVASLVMFGAPGALAVGATAVGAPAIGALAIRRLVVKRGKIGRLDIEEPGVGRSRVWELLVEQQQTQGR